MDAQEIIALGIVAIVVALAVRKRLRSRNSKGCDSCGNNPGNQANGTQNEQVVRFMPKPK